MNNRPARVWWIIVGVLAVPAFPSRAAEPKGVFGPAPAGIPSERGNAVQMEHGPAPEFGRLHARAVNGRPEASSLVPLVVSAVLLFWARRRGAFGRPSLVPVRVRKTGGQDARTTPIRCAHHPDTMPAPPR